MSKLSIFEHFLSVGNLKTKLQWCFKAELKPKLFLLNWSPKESSADGEFPYQVIIIALVQAAICGMIAYLICSANTYLSLCNKVTLTALVLFEFAVLASGVGLYLGFRDNNTG